MREIGTPIHWLFYGNEGQAHTWIGIARKLLAILKTRVELGFNLGMDEQRHEMGDRTVIWVKTWEDRDEIIIDVRGVEEEKEDYRPYLWIGTRIIGLSSGDDNNVGGTPDSYPDCFDTYTLVNNERVWIKRGAPELLPYLWEPYQEDAEFPVSVLHVFDSSDGTDNGLVYPLGSLFNDEIPIGPDWNENAFPLDTFDPLDNGSLETLDTWDFGFNQRGIGYYTKNGAWVTVGPYTYDPKYNPDNENTLWLTTMVVDPSDGEKDYEGRSRAFRAPWQVFPEMEPTAGSIEKFGPYPATILSGVYVFKLSAIGKLCGACHDNNGESGDSYLPPAMVEVEVRLGKQPGKVTTRRFRFNLDAFSNYNRDVIPYGWHGFNRDDPPGPGYGPTNHLAGNWWNSGLLIDIKKGRIIEVKDYWLQDKNDSPLEQYTLTPYQGYADYPFVLEPDPSPACDPCGTNQSPSTSIPGYNASFFPYYKLDGRESPDILVGLTARVIALRCNYDADGIWHEDYVQQVQVDNECRNHSRTEPLGNGLSFPATGVDSTTDEVPDQGLPALSGFSLGEQVYIWATQPGKVTVLKMDDPEVPGEASRMDNTCGGASQHIKYLGAVGIVPEEIDESYEIVDTFNGDPWP